MLKVIVLSTCSLLLLAQIGRGAEATKLTKNEKGFDYDGEENGGEHAVGKGQHHKISFKETDKYVSSAGDRNTEVTAYGAGGSYSLQIQVKVPLQTPYSSKRGGSGGYDGSLGQ